jgi:ABC-type taurine transport system substrate-binding protein
VLKQWSRVYDNRVDPLVKQMEKLHTVLAHDMVQAVAFLAQAVNTLDAYAEVAPPTSVPGATQPGGQSTEPGGKP